MKFETKVIHAGVQADPTSSAIMTPIYQTSTYVQSAPGEHKGYEYGRTQNPTRDALQNNLAALEQGTHAFAFASGLAAADTLIKTLSPDDEVIVTNDLYGGTYRLFERVFASYNIKFRFVDMQDTQSLQKHFNEHTKMVWVETPTNPLMRVIDIQAIAKLTELTEGKNIQLVVDNTFASPYLQRPLELGADVVVHSITKYISGHSDVVMGCIVVKDAETAEKIAFLQNACGAVPSPNDCFLALRGIKTLAVRMDRHVQNAKHIVAFLSKHEKVQKVYYPGLETHQGHEIAKKQMDDFGAMLSFELKDERLEAAFAFLKQTKLFALAESLGGVESLCGHPASMTHASIPKEERLKSGLKDTLIRLSVGIENHEDLIEDLKTALDNEVTLF